MLSDEAGDFWVGWHLPGPGRRWSKVCTALSWGECWATLTGVTEGGDLLVTPAASDPNRAPARRGRFLGEAR